MAEEKKDQSTKIPPRISSLIDKAKSDGNYAKVKDALRRESDSLVEVANNTFKELCRTLDSEQTKLSSLEKRRKQLHEEMLLLKEEIEREKESCKMDLETANTHVGMERMRKFDLPTDAEIDELELEADYERPSGSPKPSNNEEIFDDKTST